MLPEYFTSKEATFILRNGESRSWWFPFTTENGCKFFTVEYLPENTPHLEAANSYPDIKDAAVRLMEMTKAEGWEFIKGKDEFVGVFYDIYGITQLEKTFNGEHPCAGCVDENSDGERCVNEGICVAWKFYMEG